MAALRTYFAAAQIGKSAIAAMRAEDVSNAVGDVTLRDSVEGDTHSRARKGNPSRADFDRAPIDELACAFDHLQWRPFRRRRVIAEKMRRIERP